MAEFDPRVTPVRPDLAALHLEGKVQAAHFAEGTPYEVNDPAAPVRREPHPEAPLDTEALMGERVTVYEINEEGWAWGQLENDDYVGYLPASALVPPALMRTHKVSAAAHARLPRPVDQIAAAARRAVWRADRGRAHRRTACLYLGGLCAVPASRAHRR